MLFTLALNFKHIALYYAMGTHALPPHSPLFTRKVSDPHAYSALFFSCSHCPAFFCFLLRRCLDRETWALTIAHVAKLGVTVLVTFTALWSPFCLVKAADGESCVAGLLHGEASTSTRMYPRRSA